MAKGIQDAIEEYRQNQGSDFSKPGQQHRKTYSKGAFVDAIVEFIISDDQVS